VLAARARTLFDAKDYSGALEAATEELALRRESYGAAKDGPRLLSALDALASVHEALAQPREALPFLMRCLRIERGLARAGEQGATAAGPAPAPAPAPASSSSSAGSAEVAAVLFRAGSALMAVDDGPEAFKAMSQCYLLRRAHPSLGPLHPLTLRAKQAVLLLTRPDFEVDRMRLEEIPLLRGEEEDEGMESQPQEGKKKQDGEAGAAATEPVAAPSAGPPSAAVDEADDEDEDEAPVDIDALRNAQKK